MHETYNTVDSRIRHTVDVGLGQQNNFQRGAGYRSSLQDVHSSGSGVCYRRYCCHLIITPDKFIEYGRCTSRSDNKIGLLLIFGFYLSVFLTTERLD